MTERKNGEDPVDPTIRADLRAASDGIMGVIESLRDIEAAKRQHRPGSPEFLWYAERVEELSRIVAGLSTREREAAERADAEPGESPVTVEETPAPSIPELLEHWREAERRLAAAEPGSPEARQLEAECNRARQLYRHAIDRLGARRSLP